LSSVSVPDAPPMELASLDNFDNEAEPTMLAAKSSSTVPQECSTVEILGSTGVGALVVTFLALLVTTVAVLFKAHGASAAKRKFYYINSYITGIATLAYFAMLSDQGWVAITGCRQFFYARFVDMGITTPLILLHLGTIAGVDSITITALMSSDVLMVYCAYMGAISVVATVKWFWFLFSVAFFIPIVYSLTRSFREAATSSGHEAVHELYSRLAWITVVSWCFYPIVWLFSVGFASFSVSLEVIAYALLDLVSKCVYTFVVIGNHEALEYTKGGRPAESREYV